MNPRMTRPGSPAFGFSSGRPTSDARWSYTVNTDLRTTGLPPSRAATRLATPSDNPSDSPISRTPVSVVSLASLGAPPRHMPGGKVISVGSAGGDGDVITEGTSG